MLHSRRAESRDAAAITAIIIPVIREAHARSRGCRAMQFDFVVGTNQRAVRLWQPAVSMRS